MKAVCSRRVPFSSSDRMCRAQSCSGHSTMVILTPSSWFVPGNRWLGRSSTSEGLTCMLMEVQSLLLILNPLGLEMNLKQQLWEKFLLLLSPMQSVQLLKLTVVAISREDLGAELRVPFSKCFLVLTVRKSHLWQFWFFCHCRFLHGIYFYRQDPSEYFFF